MELTVWLDLVRNVGFPIAVALYLLVRLDRQIQKMVRHQLEENGYLARILDELRSQSGKGPHDAGP